MELEKQNCCQNCGGDLYQISETEWKCRYCGGIFTDVSVEKHVRTLQQLFDETKIEIVSNLRRNLYDAINAEYFSNEKVISICAELKKYLPDDFLANFYDVAARDNDNELASYIAKIDVDENYSMISIIVDFLIRSLQPRFLLALNDLIERAYKGRDIGIFEKYATAVSVEIEKVESGVYETNLPRDVFVAYSSKDMPKVIGLVNYLEAQGLTCFVAARNLRHGRGAVENYNKALEEAMANCKTFVFVSSKNSRSFGCDAVKIEIPFIKKLDIDKAPPEYRDHYDKLPEKYKKYRVEYRIDESTLENLMVSEFFNSYEWALSATEVAKRVMKFISSEPMVDEIVVSKKTEEVTVSSNQIVKPAIAAQPSVNAEPIVDADSVLALARAKLEIGEWDKVIEYCGNVFLVEPYNATAHVFKLLAQLKKSKIEKLSELQDEFDHLEAYRSVLDYADKETAGQIRTINEKIKERKQKLARKEKEKERVEQWMKKKDTCVVVSDICAAVYILALIVAGIYGVIKFKIFTDFDILSVFKCIVIITLVYWLKIFDITSELFTTLIFRKTIKKEGYDVYLLYDYLYTKDEYDVFHQLRDCLFLDYSVRGRRIVIAKYAIKYMKMLNFCIMGYIYFDTLVYKIEQLRLVYGSGVFDMSGEQVAEFLGDMFVSPIAILFYVLCIALKITGAVINKKYNSFRKDFKMPEAVEE